MTEAEERAAVVKAARSLIGTPYHHNGWLPGVGLDCATSIIVTFRLAGVVNAETPKPYAQQWMLHHSAELYLAEVTKYLHETDKPLPGDVVLWKIGRTFSHGAIIVDPGWPVIVHALLEARMVIEDRGDGGRLAGREHKFYTRW